MLNSKLNKWNKNKKYYGKNTKKIKKIYVLTIVSMYRHCNISEYRCSLFDALI